MATKTAPEQKEIKTEEQVASVLGERYASPAYAFLTRVRNQTGYNHRVRTADAVAMSLFPSRGMEMNGFEIKVSRSDLVHELMQPDKSAEIQQFCDFWWIVVSDEKILENVQIPVTWGVISVKGGKCKVIKKAPQLKAKPLSREFVASILRNVTETYVKPSEVARIREEAQVNAKHGMESEYHQMKFLKDHVAEFEKASGVKISDRWQHSGKEFGEAVRFVLNGSEELKRKIGYIVSSAKDLIKSAEKLEKAL